MDTFPKTHSVVCNMGTFLVYKVYLKIDLEERGGKSLEMIKLSAH